MGVFPAASAHALPKGYQVGGWGRGRQASAGGWQRAVWHALLPGQPALGLSATPACAPALPLPSLPAQPLFTAKDSPILDFYPKTFKARALGWAGWAGWVALARGWAS